MPQARVVAEGGSLESSRKDRERFCRRLLSQYMGLGRAVPEGFSIHMRYAVNHKKVVNGWVGLVLSVMGASFVQESVVE